METKSITKSREWHVPRFPFLLPVENYTLANEPSPTQTILILVPCDIHFHFTKLESMDAASMLPSTQSGITMKEANTGKDHLRFVFRFSTWIALPRWKCAMFFFQDEIKHPLSLIIIVFIESSVFLEQVKDLGIGIRVEKLRLAVIGNVSGIDYYFKN
jgi:hypothetical protein